jgi:hypothetical protein
MKFHLMKASFFLLALLALAFITPTFGQVAAPPVPARISSSHLQAAETMIGLASSPEAYNQSVDQKLEMMFKQFPEGSDLNEARKKLRTFINKYLSWQSIQPELAAMYAQRFTEAELRELISFYRTPVGRKLALIGPQLSQARMEIGQRRMQEHKAEFEQLFQQ